MAPKTLEKKVFHPKCLVFKYRNARFLMVLRAPGSRYPVVDLNIETFKIDPTAGWLSYPNQATLVFDPRPREPRSCQEANHPTALWVTHGHPKKRLKPNFGIFPFIVLGGFVFACSHSLSGSPYVTCCVVFPTKRTNIMPVKKLPHPGEGFLRSAPVPRVARSLQEEKNPKEWQTKTMLKCS